MSTWREKLGLAGTDTLIYNDKVKGGRRIKVRRTCTDSEMADMKASLEAAGETVLEAKQHTYKHMGFLELHSVVFKIAE